MALKYFSYCSMSTEFCWRNATERENLKKPRSRWEDNIKRVFLGSGMGHGVDLSGSGVVKVPGCCEYGNEPSRCVK
jgi:hypothetical protein